MKKLILSVSLLLTAGYMFAQTYSAPDVESYKKKVAKSDLTIKDAKKSLKTKTWISRGDLFYEMGTAYTKFVRAGMAKGEANLLMGKPSAITSETIGEKQYEVYAFDGIKLYFEGDVVSHWVVTTVVDDNAYFTAFDSYNKVIEMDTEKKTYKSLSDKLNLLHNGFIQDGSNYYSLEQFESAAKNFEAAYNTFKLEPIAKEDTTMAYYAAVAYQTAKNHDKAIELFKKALELGYAQDGNTYLYLYSSCQEIGDTLAGITYLKDGFTKYPQNNNIIGNLINYYIAKKENIDEVLQYIYAAKKNSPENASLYFAEGVLLDQMGKTAEAKKAYAETITIDANNFNANYNLGVLIFNEGVELFKQAGKLDLSKTKEYNDMVEKAIAKYAEALPFFETCYRVNPEERASLENIKQITFQFRNKDAKMKKRYEEVLELLKN